MAKKQKLSNDELLQQAIVKDENTPYSIPSNWVWTKWGYVGKFIAGNAFKPELQGFSQFNIPFYKVGSLKDSTHDGYLYDRKNTINEEMMKKLRATLLPKNSVIFAKIGEAIRLNRRCLNPEPCCVDNNLMAFVSDESLFYKFVYYWSYTQDFYGLANATTVPAIRKSDLEKILFPLPPLAEQHRIVDLVESLFEKLDRAKELVQTSIESFENRKSVILHKAFTGELTAKWRKEKGMNFNWERQPLKKVSNLRAGFAFDSSRFCDTGYQVIRMGNLYNEVLDLTRNPVFIKEVDIDEKVLQRSKINIGDILLTLTGTKYKRDYGFAVLILDEAKMLLNQRILCLTPKSVETKYLLYYLKTNLFRDVFFSNETGGVNQGNVSSKFVETIEIPIPHPEEQKEIVRLLDNLLTSEDKAKELCDVIDNIELMKKSILGRAFRSELNTNNPDEESALKILKESLKEKVEA